MGRPSSITPEQLAEMIKLSAVKTRMELAEIYHLDHSTIGYHLRNAGITHDKKPFLSYQQVEEIIKLSAIKTIKELSEIYKRDRATIYYHLKRAKITNRLLKKFFYLKEPAKKIFKPKPQLKREEKINAGKNYVDYLKIENEERKNKGLYLFKQGK